MAASYNTCFIERNIGCLRSTIGVVKLGQMNLGKRVEAERLARDWTQAKLASMVNAQNAPDEEKTLSQRSIHRAVDMPELLSGDSQGSVVQSMNVNRKLV